jgi:hypothetical protein
MSATPSSNSASLGGGSGEILSLPQLPSNLQLRQNFHTCVQDASEKTSNAFKIIAEQQKIVL